MRCSWECGSAANLGSRAGIQGCHTSCNLPLPRHVRAAHPATPSHPAVCASCRPTPPHPTRRPAAGAERDAVAAGARAGGGRRLPAPLPAGVLLVSCCASRPLGGSAAGCVAPRCRRAVVCCTPPLRLPSCAAWDAAPRAALPSGQAQGGPELCQAVPRLATHPPAHPPAHLPTHCSGAPGAPQGARAAAGPARQHPRLLPRAPAAGARARRAGAAAGAAGRRSGSACVRRQLPLPRLAVPGQRAAGAGV